VAVHIKICQTNVILNGSGNGNKLSFLIACCTLSTFFFLLVGPTVYTVQATVEYAATHYVGRKWEARMVERFLRYIVNGIPGQGVSEFHYYNKGGRPSSVAENDPFWFKKLNLQSAH
jgi:hypothetical protein